MPLTAGERLGPYEVLAPIGAGGMGEVYRARDTKLGRDVALKVLPEPFAGDPERMARFEREAQVLASLNHLNIATIYGLEEINDVRALVIELVEGPTLAERIGGRAMPLEDALPIAKQIAEGLEYAHEKGVVHRDLKPANIKLTADATVKLLDFGLAKALEEPKPHGNPSISPTLTIQGSRAGVILGTAGYMSPEQARGAVVDKRADIWAYGVVLYEMLTGKQPFAGPTVSDTLAAVLRADPDWDALPASMRPLVRRCLEKDARQRLRDIGDARIALGETAGQVVPKPAPKRAIPWAIAGILAAIALVALWSLWRATRPVPQPMMWLSVELPEFAMMVENLAPGSSVALSPDGTRVVYTGHGPDGKFHLYTRTFDAEQAVPLAGTEDGFGPFFSPDGQSVGFFTDDKLKKVSVQGGAAEVLCDAPNGRGASWGENGNIIAALDIFSGLSRVSSAGGPVQPATELKLDLAHNWPQVLPGAQAVLFTARIPGGVSIMAQSLKTGERKTLVADGYYGRYVPSGHLVYMRQGILYGAPMDTKRLELTGPPAPVVDGIASDVLQGSAQMDVARNGTLLYVKGKPARQNLSWLDSSGRTQPFHAQAAELFGPSRFSPDGKRLALSKSEAAGKYDVWVYEWERDTMTRLTSESGGNYYPVWSPDGQHIAFSSRRAGGAVNLYWMRTDGSGDVVRLTNSKNSQYTFSFSPDGTRLAFTELDARTNWDLWTLPLEDVASGHPKAGTPEPFLQTRFSERWPMISPDGRWLAYGSNESGRYEVYVRRFPNPGGKWLVSTGGGIYPVWSKKEPELYYRTGEGMMAVRYNGNGETFAARPPRLWAEKKNLGQWYDSAPDGKRFVVIQSEVAEQKGPVHVMLLQNFFDELRRRAPVGGK